MNKSASHFYGEPKRTNNCKWQCPIENCNPGNLYQINNVEDIVVFPGLKVPISDNSYSSKSTIENNP